MSEIGGIGMDLCAISRMQNMLGHAHFLERILTPDEQAYIQTKGAQAAQSLAAIWAAKESVLKALGVGISIPLTDIEIVHDAHGKPCCRLSGEALRLARGGTMHLSLTHESDMAGAFCVWELHS